MMLVPLAREPWNEIVPGLWQGGHDYQPDGYGTAILAATVGTEFDVVLSLFRRRTGDYGPPESVEHHRIHLILDGALDRIDLEAVKALAVDVALDVRSGRRVLVRCQAGYNRSGLVVALALLRLGYAADDAIDLIRSKRSRYALCNAHFERYVREAGA